MTTQPNTKEGMFRVEAMDPPPVQVKFVALADLPPSVHPDDHIFGNPWYFGEGCALRGYYQALTALVHTTMEWAFNLGIPGITIGLDVTDEPDGCQILNCAVRFDGVKVGRSD